VPGAIDVYKAYQAAFARAPSLSLAVEPFDRSQIDYFWFFRAIDRALQGKYLERELIGAQTLTEQYLTCVRGGTPDRTCARQVDPDYRGQQNSTP
jgi:hypothetical protein